MCARRISQTGQRGAALLALIVMLVVGAAAVFYGLYSPAGPDIEKDRKTAAALAQAKAALIGYAVSVTLSNLTTPLTRPGDLPCPDTNDDGSMESGCGNAAGTTGQTTRIGRLPWRNLGLPDLRDGDGERLWYAVSNNFKYNTRTGCTTPGAAGCLNSDTRGTITIRDSAGNILYDATNADPGSSGVIAVIFSPGAVLHRQGAAAAQNRTCTGGACNAQGTCTTSPATNTPKCNPANYLDISGTEDNADFADGSASNGFIHGIIRDANGNVIVNDRLMVITHQDLMPQVEKRVAAEVLNCMTGYASANNGRYPWAVPVTDVTLSFDDAVNTLFGRVPDWPLTQSRVGIVAPSDPAAALLQAACLLTPASCMSTNWPNLCPLPVNPPPANTWWNNWKLHVFYGVADAYKPLIAYTQPTPTSVALGGVPSSAGCPDCLTVDPPGASADKQVVIMVSGRRLPAVAGGQPRTSTVDWQNPANYLEGGNDTHPAFSRQSGSTTFNDTVVYK